MRLSTGRSSRVIQPRIGRCGCCIGTIVGGCGTTVFGASPGCPSNMLAANNPPLMRWVTIFPFRVIVRWCLHRSVENTDFNTFARHARVAEHAFSTFALAELVQILVKLL